MNEFLDYEFFLDGHDVKIEREHDVTFEGRFIRRSPVLGEVQDRLKNTLASFEDARANQWLQDVNGLQIKVVVPNGTDAIVDYNYKQSRALVSYKGRLFLMLFHREVWVSIFEQERQIASLKISNSALHTRYKLSVRKEIGMECLFWPLMCIIYKLGVADDNEIALAGPLQDVRAFDPYWKQK